MAQGVDFPISFLNKEQGEEFTDFPVTSVTNAIPASTNYSMDRLETEPSYHSEVVGRK